MRFSVAEGIGNRTFGVIPIHMEHRRIDHLAYVRAIERRSSTRGGGSVANATGSGFMMTCSMEKGDWDLNLLLGYDARITQKHLS